MDSILLYTDDNIIGQSIHDYMIDRARDITTLKFQDIVKGVGASPAATVIINIIHKDISAYHNGRITEHFAQAPDALRAAGADRQKRAVQPVPGAA